MHKYTREVYLLEVLEIHFYIIRNFLVYCKYFFQNFLPLFYVAKIVF